MKQAVVCFPLLAVLFMTAACSPQAGASANSGNEVQVPANTNINVKLDKDLDSGKIKKGDTFTAHLEQPIVANGQTVAPAGTVFKGEVTDSEVAKQAGSAGKLGLTLKSFTLNGHTYDIQTSSYEFANDPIKQSDSEMAKDPASPAPIRKGVENALVTRDTVLIFALQNGVNVRAKS